MAAEGHRQARTREMRESVYDWLIAHINSDELPVDGRLVEDSLAATFQVSRTPVREALQRLEQEGLVVHTTGWYVRPPSHEGARNVFEFRIAIEGYAARLTAARASAGDLAAMAEVLDAMEAPGLDRRGLNELNERYHDLVTSASGNQRLLEGRRSASIKYWAFRSPIVFPLADLVTVNRQHRELFACFLTHDADGAERITRDHIEATQQIVLAGLASLNPPVDREMRSLAPRRGRKHA